MIYYYTVYQIINTDESVNKSPFSVVTGCCGAHDIATVFIDRQYFELH